MLATTDRAAAPPVAPAAIAGGPVVWTIVGLGAVAYAGYSYYQYTHRTKSYTKHSWDLPPRPNYLNPIGDFTNGVAGPWGPPYPGTTCAACGWSPKKSHGGSSSGLTEQQRAAAAAAAAAAARHKRVDDDARTPHARPPSQPTLSPYILDLLQPKPAIELGVLDPTLINGGNQPYRPQDAITATQPDALPPLNTQLADACSGGGVAGSTGRSAQIWTCGDDVWGDLYQKRAAELIDAVETRYLEITVGGLPTSQSNNRRGPVVSGVIDSLTGNIFFGQNHDTVSAALHPLMASRLESYLDHLDGRRVPLKGEPGTHSEFYALNEALLARPGANIGDFLIYNLRLKGTQGGKPIPPCANCSALTEGAQYVQ